MGSGALELGVKHGQVIHEGLKSYCFPECVRIEEITYWLMLSRNA